MGASADDIGKLNKKEKFLAKMKRLGQGSDSLIIARNFSKC